jgi:hypothetical protein
MRKRLDRRFRHRCLAGDRPRSGRRDWRVAVDHLVALSTAGAPQALLRSLSVNVVVEDVFGAQAFGLKTRASSSTRDGRRRSGQRVDASAHARQAAETRSIGERSACAGGQGVSLSSLGITGSARPQRRRRYGSS